MPEENFPEGKQMSLRFEKAFSIQQPPGGGGGGQEINNQDLTITANGTYTAEEGYTGIGTATVSVQPNLISKTITENGTYLPGVGVDGYNEVAVNVPRGGLQTSVAIAPGFTATLGSIVTTVTEEAS